MVAITAAIALVALAAPAWAKPKPKPQSKTLAVSPTEVKSGQLVKVSGGGCQGITVLVFLIDGMGAECRGSKHKPARFHVKKKSSKDKDDDKEKGKDKERDKGKTIKWTHADKHSTSTRAFASRATPRRAATSSVPNAVATASAPTASR
jgi:hypothetical protein